MKWFVARPGGAQGPFSDAELRALAQSRRLGRTDLLANDGAATWRHAGRVLADAFPRINWVPPSIAALLAFVLAALAAWCFLATDDWSLAFHATDLRALFWVAAIACPASLALVTWLTRAAARESTRWSAIRDLILPTIAIATSLLAIKLHVISTTAAIADEQFTYKLESPSPTVIRFSGEIGRRFPADLRAAVQSTTRTIEVLYSDGGAIGPAVAAADVIRWNRLNIRVVGTCYSACVALFSAAQYRELVPSALLGLHRSTDLFDGGDLVAGDEAYVQLLRDAGFSERILKQRLSYSPGDMWRLRPTEVRLELPKFGFIDPKTNRPIEDAAANLLFVSDQFGLMGEEVARHSAEAFRWAYMIAPEVVGKHGAALGTAFRSGDQSAMEKASTQIILGGMRVALATAQPALVREYWQMEGGFSEEAFRAQEFVRCGAPSATEKEKLVAFISLKNRVMASSVQSGTPVPSFTDGDVARFQNVMIENFPTRSIPAEEFDPMTPRASCALGVAVSRAMLKSSDTDLLLFNAINSAE